MPRDNEVKDQAITFTCNSDIPTSRKVVAGIRALIDSRTDEPKTVASSIGKFNRISDITLNKYTIYSYEISYDFRSTKRQALSLFATLLTQILGLGSNVEIKSIKLKEVAGGHAASLATDLKIDQAKGHAAPFTVQTNYYYCINPKTDVRKLCHSRNIPKQPYITECIFTDKRTGDQGIGLSVCSFKENTPVKSEGRKHATRRAFEALEAKVSIEPVSSSTLRLILPVLQACKYPGILTYMGRYRPMAQRKDWVDPLEKPCMDKVKIRRPPDISVDPYLGAHAEEDKFAAAFDFWFKDELHDDIQAKKEAKVDKPSDYQSEIWPTSTFDVLRYGSHQELKNKESKAKAEALSFKR